MEPSKVVNSILISVAATCFGWWLIQQSPPQQKPYPPIRIEPVVVPERDKKPHMPRLPRLRGELTGKIVAGGPVGPDGKTAVDVDMLAVPNRKHNISSRGLGCCVFRSLEYAARWQNVPQLFDFPEWMVKTGIAGGGYPDKVAKLIPQISKARGLPTPDFVNYEGGSPEIIKLALKTGRVACVTYSGSDHVHYSGRIAHMLCCVAWSDEADLVALCDNNFPAEVLWMTRGEFLQRWKGDGGWCCVLLSPGPPPPPTN